MYHSENVKSIVFEFVTLISLNFSLFLQDPASPQKFVLDGDKLKTKGTFDVDVKDPVTLYKLTLK